jgi:hypothetical protein
VIARAFVRSATNVSRIRASFAELRLIAAHWPEGRLNKERPVTQAVGCFGSHRDGGRDVHHSSAVMQSGRCFKRHEMEWNMKRAAVFATAVAGLMATALPASAQGWGWNGGYWGDGVGVSVGFGGPYYDSYAYAGPGACTCGPRVAYGTWGTPGYAYESDYGYAYAPDYAYGYDYGYGPGVSVGFGFSSDRSFRHRDHRFGRHWNGSRTVIRDRQRTVAGDRGFTNTNFRGNTNFGGDTTIRSRGHRAQLSGNAQARAQFGNDGRGHWGGQNNFGNARAQFRGDTQMGAGAQMGGRSMKGSGRGHRDNMR